MDVALSNFFNLICSSYLSWLYRWFGKCWYVHNLLKYEFDIEFDVSFIDFLVINYHVLHRLQAVPFLLKNP